MFSNYAQDMPNPSVKLADLRPSDAQLNSTPGRLFHTEAPANKKALLWIMLMR